MRAKQVAVICALSGLFFAPVYAYECKGCSSSRSDAMGQTVLAVQHGESAVRSATGEAYGRNDVMISDEDESGFSVSVEPRIGYIRGETAYDWQHQRSELYFPYDNWMGGVAVSIAKGRGSLNGEFWVPLEGDAGDMKDRDWLDGDLVSETFSRSELDAVILDGNLRYDFFKRTLDTTYGDVALWEDDTVTVGALLGYRYERYDYDIYDLYYSVDLLYGHEGEHLYSGTRVLTYKIEYYLPYLGLAADVKRQNFGFGGSLKYSFYPKAEHVDNHLLRGLTLYADYDEGGVSILGSVYGYWDFYPQWRLRGGVDLMLSRLDGTNRDESGDPGWVGPISTDMRYVIGWLGAEYRF